MDLAHCSVRMVILSVNPAVFIKSELKDFTYFYIWELRLDGGYPIFKVKIQMPQTDEAR